MLCIVANIMSLKFIEIFEIQNHKAKLFFFMFLFSFVGDFLQSHRSNNIMCCIHWSQWPFELINFPRHLILQNTSPSMGLIQCMLMIPCIFLRFIIFNIILIYIPEILKISGLPLGSPETKCHLDAGPMANHRVYYKGEGGGFPQVWAMVSLVSLSLHVVRLSTKKCSSYALTNLWFGLCRSVWVIDRLSFFLVPSRRSSMPFYP